MELDDTNLPYLWSIEGVARLFRGALGLQKGIPKIKVSKGNYDVIVEKSVSTVRPFIAAFVAKGGKIDDYLLKQFVQLQEKFCESYGRKRQKVSIGLYSHTRIKFPVHYKALSPNSVKFVPLGLSEELNLAEILEKHPKGIEYRWILNGFKSYPILLDDKGDVLSFPPIINSDYIGKLEAGDSDVFFEVTGTDEKAVMLAANIFAYAFFDRGFDLFSVDIKYPDRNIISPRLSVEKIKIGKGDVESLIGLDLKEAEIKNMVEMAGFDFSNFMISIPPYRADIMHSFDVVEDIAIMYGFDKIEPKDLESYTVGHKLPIADFTDKVREIAIGLGYQEVMSPILSNKAVLYNKMNSADLGTVEIENVMSELFSVVRTWLIPLLIEVLSKNKHVDYPQKVFEQGLVTLRKGDSVSDREKIAFVSSHSLADYTESKQAVDYVMRQLGVEFEIKEVELPSFIPGRCAAVFVGKKNVGFFGEISPAVLSNWELEMPVVAVELNLSELFSTSES